MNHTPVGDAGMVRKLRMLDEEHRILIDPRDKLDLSTAPTHPRMSYPIHITPPSELATLRSIAGVIGKSNALGEPPYALGIASVDDCLSSQVNVSTDPRGYCHITPLVLTSWSHAGSHIDTPHHWMKNPPFDRYPMEFYNGGANILDLTDHLRGTPRAITPEIIRLAAQQQEIDVNSVYRLLFRTYDRVPDFWDPHFAYFTPDAAELLAGLNKLVLVATDSVTVDDHPSSKPIGDQSHGTFYKGRVALLEGVHSDNMPKEIRRGAIQTTATPLYTSRQGMPYDALTVTVSLYLLHDAR